MAKSANYWKERMKALEDTQYKKTTEYYNDLQKQFRIAQRNLQIDIEYWYQRLAANNEISLSEAKKLLDKNELEEFHWTVEEYIKHGEENDLNRRWMKQLENASARVHINRLEAMKLQIQQHTEILYQNYEHGTSKFLSEIYEDGYYHTAYEIAKGTGIGSSFSRVNTSKIDEIVNTPWAQDGKAFSDRIWQNKDKLVRELHTELTQSLIRGENPDMAAKRLAKTMGSKLTHARTLVYTESAAISSAAQKDSLQELGVEEFEVVETLDRHTCSTCGDMDGRHFPMKDFEIGVTAPPFHPRCRGCTCPYFDDEFTTGERIARGEDGKQYYVSADMTYKQWQKSFVEGDKSGLQEVIPEKEITIEEIKKQVAENNTRIEALTSEYSQKHQAFENALLFGNEDVDTLNRMSQEVQTIKIDLDDIIAKTDALKNKLLQESVQTVQSVVIEGKNLIGDVDYTSPELANFDHVIEKSIHAQGFDGNPSVVEYEDFKKAMEESGFYAERTYSANTQELLDEYREQLYNGKWYVDCSEGGAQYGQGMYCASCYDLANNEQMGGIGMEMSHYQQIGLGRGNGFYYTESITLQPDAKIFELPSGMKADEYIADAFRNSYMKKFATKEQLVQVEQYVELSEQISNLTFTESSEFIDNLYQKRADASIGLEDLIKASLTAMEDTTDGKTYHGLKNPGVLVTEMGYDAIKATGHGDSGSYTVILNRTKVLFCKGGSIYGN